MSTTPGVFKRSRTKIVSKETASQDSQKGKEGRFSRY